MNIFKKYKIYKENVIKLGYKPISFYKFLKFRIYKNFVYHCPNCNITFTEKELAKYTKNRFY